MTENDTEKCLFPFFLRFVLGLESLSYDSYDTRTSTRIIIFEDTKRIAKQKANFSQQG